MINAKKAKALRRFLRVTGLDPQDREYVVQRVPAGGYIVLNLESGRAVYQRLKPLWA